MKQIFLLWYFLPCIVYSKQSANKPVKYQRFSSSMVEMNKLFKAETELIDKIRELMIEMQPKLSEFTIIESEKLHELDFIMRKIDGERNLERDHGEAQRLHFLRHPVNQFRLMRRFFVEFPEIGKIFELIADNDKGKELRESIDNLRLSKSDFMEVGMALLRLAYVYDIPLHELTDIEGSDGVFPLDQHDLASLGINFMDHQRYHDSANIFYSAIITGGDVDVDFLRDVASEAYWMANDDEHKKFGAALRELIIMNGKYEELDRVKATGARWRNIVPELEYPGMLRLNQTENVMENERLCKAIETGPALYCFYNHGREEDFNLKWTPLKTEVLYEDPYIVRYYDVISENKIKWIRNATQYGLNRLPPVPGEKNYLTRLSGRAQMRAGIYPEIDKITENTAKFADMEQSSMDLWAVQNYGIAGFEIGTFKYIYNTTTKAQPTEGNWMASWISFMSDVEYGGSVSFWEIGLAVKPIKGSAIMWYNLLPDGNVDPRVGISHCPVFIGSKWILPRNFWSTMNMERHRCPAAYIPSGPEPKYESLEKDKKDDDDDDDDDDY